ncbi:outer membrane protein assembly factor BamB family protein [Lignipirellula cremea]|uniref:Outer membrane biogenesis protein BamB n=1 Tax=Lignipirellula cremea TaxID=2528010 RepID=A0A518DLI7_9BACT|nr:PQQ-binding-like beta-propeller repeat protein [Lignipirellula cremea]QDU92700.1 outer membrane biogenesis protein BamB [Lignipirellula cremea]
MRLRFWLQGISCAGLMLCASMASGQIPGGDWSQWRGPQRDGVNHQEKNLLRAWPEGGPEVVWKVDNVGVGYSSIAIQDGRIFTQGDLNGIEHIIALSVKDGSLLWAVQPEPVRQQLEEKVAKELAATDKNQDGQIDEAEALARFGTEFNKYDQPTAGDAEAHEKLARQRAQTLLAALDANGDGQIDGAEGAGFRDEFSRIDSEDKSADADALAAQRTAALMKELDTDGDGSLSKEEINKSPLGRTIGRADQRDPATNKADNVVTAAELTEYLAQREKGRDGFISQDELAAYHLQRNPGGDGLLSKEELTGYFGGYRNGQGDGPRGTPTVEGDRVYVEGGNGDLTCLEAATGKTIWHVNMSTDLGGGRPGWGYSESPLLLNDLVIVTPGGKQGTLAALNKMTGEVVWRSEGVTDGAHYASAVRATIGGVDQIVQITRTSAFGVTLDGKGPLWQYDGANNGTANACTPIVADDSVFTSSAYGTGGGLAKITTTAAGQSAEEEYFEKKMAVHHGGIVKIDDFLYGFGNNGLICMNFHTGDIAWHARSVSKGSLTAADGLLFLLGENHQVALAEASSGEYRELGSFKIESHGRPSWAHPVVAGGILYLRDQNSLTAYKVSQ